MTNFEVIEKLIQEHGGSIRSSEAVAAGVSVATLSKYVSTGLLVRFARGQYTLPGEPTDELYMWQDRMHRLVYSHETAMYLHGMSEESPGAPSITLPSDARLSSTFPREMKVYYAAPDIFTIGLIPMPTGKGHIVRTYDIERTVCDLLRSRSRVGKRTVIAAFKNYVARPDKDMIKLSHYAGIFHMTNLLRDYLELLL